MGQGVAPVIPALLALAPTVAAPVARLLLYIGVIVVLGRALVGVVASPAPGGTSSALRALLYAGVAALLMAPLALLQLQLSALEMPLAEASMLLRDSAWGRGWIGVGAASGVSSLCLVVAARRRQVGGVLISLLVISALALAVAMGGLGHAAADARWPLVARIVDAAHVVGMGGWIGGLLVTWAATREVPSAWAMSAWRAFSRSATMLAPLALVTGLASGVLRLAEASWPHAFTSGYVRLLAVKGLVVLVVLAYGAQQRRRVHRAQVPASRAVVQETAFAMVALIVTAVLTGTEPPSAP